MAEKNEFEQCEKRLSDAIDACKSVTPDLAVEEIVERVSEMCLAARVLESEFTTEAIFSPESATTERINRVKVIFNEAIKAVPLHIHTKVDYYSVMVDRLDTFSNFVEDELPKMRNTLEDSGLNLQNGPDSGINIR